MKLLIAPHDDDAELFAAFTCLREQPCVLICLDSYTQANRGFPVLPGLRAKESEQGINELNCLDQRLKIRDDIDPTDMCAVVESALREFDQNLGSISDVWAPSWHQKGHAHHNAVSLAARVVFGDRIRRYYLTYTTDGKQTDGDPVPVENGLWVARKLRAMACHKSQMIHAGLSCRPHFMRGLDEFYERVQC